MKHCSPTTAPGDDTGANDARAAAEEENRVDVLHFTYFMVRLQQPRSTPRESELSGVVERLASGEKCTFRSAAELFRLLDSWSRASEPAATPG